MSLIDHAKRELALVGYNVNPDPTSEDVNDWAVLAILELIETFAKQRHSNFSAEYVLDIFSKLAHRESLSPLTGEDDEWCEIYQDEKEVSYQNIRDARLFKMFNKETNKETVHLLDHFIFVDKNKISFTGTGSSLNVDKFPFVVPSEQFICEGTEEAEKWIKEHGFNPFENEYKEINNV